MQVQGCQETISSLQLTKQAQERQISVRAYAVQAVEQYRLQGLAMDAMPRRLRSLVAQPRAEAPLPAHMIAVVIVMQLC
jgi:hypothetical protein